nr:Type 1 glutamine amidotransferase-like domain-containing protein [Neisseria weixii]
MPNLFLTSSFADVAALFPEFAGNPAGRSVAFIPTASMVEAYRGYVDDGRHALRSLGMAVEELDIAAAPVEHIVRTLQQSGYIYVSGNTFCLLQEMRRKNVDCMLVGHLSQGKTYRRIRGYAGFKLRYRLLRTDGKSCRRARTQRQKRLGTYPVLPARALSQRTLR